MNNNIFTSQPFTLEDRRFPVLIQRPLLSFFVITFLLSPFLLLVPNFIVLNVFDASFNIMPGEILVSWAPNIAALIVVKYGFGWKGVGKLFSQFLHWKIKGKYYFIAIGVPVLMIAVASIVLSVIVDKSIGEIIQPVSVPVIGFLFLNHLIRGPIGEEAGWRAYALPLLLKKYNFLRASIILGLIWSVWHFPFWYMVVQNLFPNDEARQWLMFLSLATVVPALGFFINWLYMKSNSLIPPLLAHLFFNVSAALFISELDKVFAVISFCWICLILVAYVYCHWANFRQGEVKCR